MTQHHNALNREVIACHECDMLHQVTPLDEGGIARCLRCGAVLYRKKGDTINRALALTLTAFILFLLANLLPFLSLRIEGQVNQTTLITGIRALYSQNMQAIAILVFVTVILIPFLQIVGMLYLLIVIQFKPLSHLSILFRNIIRLQSWGMMEIFMLGIFVSVVKLASMATISPGTALYAYFALIFAMAAFVASLDDTFIWKQFDGKAG